MGTKKRVLQKCEIYSKLYFEEKIKPRVAKLAAEKNITGKGNIKLKREVMMEMWAKASDEEIAEVEAEHARMVADLPGGNKEDADSPTPAQLQE